MHPLVSGARLGGKKMENSGIVSIKVENLYPHPDNPRKNIGDVSELAESARKNGIMQNLTVIPLSALDTEPEEQPEAESVSLLSDFHVLIGHRRLAAAKEAGLTEVPCKIISKISRKEQVGIMLEENMQREDLTIYEQAQGFQMMLDLGETEESIAEKTGFSKTTIRRRLNIAKLDQNVLKEKQNDDSFQLSLKDLYELEKVKDVNTRNKILSEANSSRDIVWKAQNAVAEAKRNETASKIIEMLKEKDIKKAPEKASNEMYTGKWDTVKSFSLDDEVPEELKYRAKKTDELFYLVHYREIKIIKKAEKKKETAEEKARKEKEKNKKQLKAIIKEMDARRKEFIQNIVHKKIAPIKETDEVQRELWSAMIALGTSLYESGIRSFITGKEDYKCTQEERDAAKAAIAEYGMTEQMLIVLNQAMNNNSEVFDWCGRFDTTKAEKMMRGYRILERYGWSFEDEENRVMDGSHELYEPEEKKNE